MTAVLAVMAAGLGSYALRVSMVLALGDRDAPAWLQRMSSFVAPAAFAALVASAFVDRAGSDDALGLGAAAIAAVAAVRVTRTANAALAVGLPVMWLVAAVTS